ncbi:MAG: transglutaminase-like domain-containing protein [Bacteroidales bacterium]
MIETSHYDKTCIHISLKNESIIISNLPVSRSFDEIMLWVKDDANNEYGKIAIKRQSKIEFDLSTLNPGMFYFQLYRKTKLENQYSSYLYDQNIPLIIHKNRIIKFKISPVYQNNIEVFNKFRTDKSFLADCLNPSNQNQSDHQQIISLTKKVIHNCNSEYTKIRNIHNWVADNIYYDMDAFNSQNYQSMDTSALGTLLSRRSVCQGYSDLSIAMLRAAGIPAMGLSCYALGISTDKKWNTQTLEKTESNHRITAAFVNKRWTITDVTWDSDNEYQNGVYRKKTGLGHSYKYFDVTIPFLSFSHRLTN